MTPLYAPMFYQNSLKLFELLRLQTHSRKHYENHNFLGGGHKLTYIQL